MTAAAIVAVALLAVVCVFQIALAVGAPWGSASWGGQHPGVLPTRLRVASGLAAMVVYPLIILLVLASADLVEAPWLPGDGTVVMWIVAGFLALGALANFASRSRRERYWGPVALAIAVCCVIIALGP